MLLRRFRGCLIFASLFALVACGGGYVPSSTVSVSILAEFEKRAIGISVLSPPTVLPARYCWVEGVDPQSGYVYFSGHLNSSGRGIAELPKDASFQIKLYARYEVPGANNFGDFRMRGSVKNGSMQPSYRDAAVFNEIPDWSISSEVYSAQDDTSIVVKAVDSGAREAGAFNVADQAIEFALKMAQLEPGLGLPNLHSFWSPDIQFTDYPRAAFDKQHQVLSQATGRTIFQHGVMGKGNRVTGGKADEYNDSALMEAFAHLLFADYSYPPIGPKSPYDRLARRDSEEIALVERQGASETTTAFVSGFCDFISAAFRNSSILMEITADAVSAYNLGQPTSFNKPQGGEFYRQSVAGVLYRIWATSFSGTQSGLQTMWDATYQPGMAKGTSSSKYPSGYLQCPIGNISSYLSGLANGARFGVNSATWNSVLAILNSESISNPTANLFSGGKFWKKVKQLPATEIGFIKAYSESDGILWDFDQARHFHFVQTKAGERRITLEMTGGQDLFLELFDSVGMLVERSEYSSIATKKEISTTLKKGEYLVRVRAGYTTQNKMAGFKLVIQ
jgi:hypothetical protein